MAFKNMGLIVQKPISEVDSGVRDGFESLGVRVVPMGLDEEWQNDLDVYLISGPFYPLYTVLAKIERLSEHRNPNVIIWLTEQRVSSRLPGWFVRTTGSYLRAINQRYDEIRKKNQRTGINRYLTFLNAGWRYRLGGEIQWLHERGYLKLLAVLAPSHQRFYAKKMHIPSQVIPFGYHISFGRDLHLERDIDVTFLGSLRDRRRAKIICRYEKAFQKMGIRFTIYDGSPERGLVFGEERTRLLNRSKILLSIMRQPWDDPVFRMLLATPNGAMVVSEPVVDDYPFKPGHHLVTNCTECIPETIKYYLEHEQERLQIVQNARGTLFNEMTNRQMAEKIMVAFESGG